MQNTNHSTLIDVRTKEEFDSGSFPGAIHVPLNQVSLRIEEIKKMKFPIILYCRSGNRSGQAITILKKAGIHDALNGGGLEDMFKKLHYDKNN